MILLVSILVAGCTMTGLESSFKASRYFNTADYQKGVEVFREKVRANPRNALDNYYLGRFYLAEGMHGEALPYLKRAAYLDPGDTDNQFWLGVAYGVVGDEKRERIQYRRVLDMSSSHSKSRLYLAHLQLKSGQYQQALDNYDKIINRYPYNAAALFNRALALKLTRKHKKEREAWLTYLKYYPSGFLAAKAADHLNILGDFSYRNHPFGYRTVTLKEIAFKPESADIAFDSRESPRLAGAVLANFTRGNLMVTVYDAGNETLARQRAVSIKRFLTDEFPVLDSNRIILSWFGTPEVLYGNSTKYENSESVRLYLTDWR
jgi:tetratricopeptide (TPR) repeat protein